MADICEINQRKKPAYKKSILFQNLYLIISVFIRQVFLEMFRITALVKYEIHFKSKRAPFDISILDGTELQNSQENREHSETKT